MGKPVFSIIIPSYNVAEFIENTIAAVTAQSFEDWELIVVDDASTDKTLEKLSGYAEKIKIKIITSEKNSGNPFAVRRKALDYASGEFIVPIDADDLVEPDLLEKIHEVIRQENIDLAIPEMWRFSSSTEDASFLLPKDEINTKETYQGKELIKETLCGWKIPMAGFAVKREIYKKAYDKVLPYDSNSGNADEFLSRIILILSEKTRFVNSRYLYRINPNSISNNKLRMIKDGITTNKSLVSLCEKEFGKESEEYHEALRQHILFLIASMGNVNHKSIHSTDKKSVYNLIKEEKKYSDISKIKHRISRFYQLMWFLPVATVSNILKFRNALTVLKS